MSRKPGVSSLSTSTTACRFSVFQQLRQVVLVCHLLDGMQLAFEVVDMMFFVDQNLLQQLARTVVGGGHAGLDAVVQPLYGRVFELQVVLELLLYVLSD